MTKQDIDNIISVLCPNDEDFEKPIISPAYLKKELEALALEQEPCEDAISRQAVDDAIYGYSRSCDVNYQQIMEFIEKIPSVKPQPKKGRWIVDGFVDCYLDKARCHCSECGKKKNFPADYNHIKQELSINYKYPELIDNYCPNCGAEMESEDKE